MTSSIHLTHSVIAATRGSLEPRPPGAKMDGQSPEASAGVESS